MLQLPKRHTEVKRSKSSEEETWSFYTNVEWITSALDSLDRGLCVRTTTDYISSLHLVASQTLPCQDYKHTHTHKHTSLADDDDQSFVTNQFTITAAMKSLLQYIISNIEMERNALYTR